MKTLIVYASKYGATSEIAKRIAEKMDNATLYDLKKDTIPALSEFDCILIGSSLYAGMIRKEAKTFLSKNMEVLCSKKIGLFLSGMDTDADKQKEYFAVNFSSELLKAAKAKYAVGGIYDPKKAGFAERVIFKLVTKTSAYSDKINNDKITQFTDVMKG